MTKSFHLHLLQRGHFTAKREGTGKIGNLKTVKTVAELKLAGCEAMGSVNYDRVKMLIPPIPSCAFENSPNITLEYFVEIVGDVFGTHKNALVNLPVVIGTIPAFQHTLKDPSQNPDAVQSIPSQPGIPPGGQPGIPPQEQQGYPPQGQQGYPPPRDGSSGYPLPGGVSGDKDLLPPPKYTAAVGGPQKIPGNFGTVGKIFYAPQYPYYDPDTMYASMGIPLGTTASSADGGPPPPTVVQPMSIQQPPQQT
ncbi:calcium-binding protein P-like [Strongylocentrotus purpuratus]|uniref:Arrestin C-terminal-like domain-containing protein n=1 Tax=Strongylocentrotus purpuratus TaxID=7668 RepID=A0A7M7N4Q6_STRPU|nr:calcium-binding protein P-like [Strongylocentrotus purpuratus]